MDGWIPTKGNTWWTMTCLSWHALSGIREDYWGFTVLRFFTLNIFFTLSSFVLLGRWFYAWTHIILLVMHGQLCNCLSMRQCIKSTAETVASSKGQTMSIKECLGGSQETQKETKCCLLDLWLCRKSVVHWPSFAIRLCFIVVRITLFRSPRIICDIIPRPPGEKCNMLNFLKAW